MHNSDVGVFTGKLSRFLSVANQDGNLPVRMCLGDSVEDVSANVPGNTCAGKRGQM